MSRVRTPSPAPPPPSISPPRPCHACTGARDDDRPGRVNGALAAAAWAGLAASSLVIGGVLALRVQFSNRVVGLVLAFGAGTLISSVAYELVPEETLEAAGTGIALAIGA